MTTARQDVVEEDGVTPADPFDMGAGHIVPNSSVDPGVTIQAGADPDATFNAYAGFFLGFIAGRDLNLPSIAMSQLVGTETTSRTFTSVEPGTVTWTAGTEGLPGIDVTLPDPVVLTGVGDEAEWDVTFTRDGAALDEWVQGAITWTSNDGHAVRIPVVLKPTQLGFPTAVSAEVEGTTGLVEWDVKSGYDGVLSADGYGLAADAVLAGQTVAQDPDQDIETGTLTSGVTTYPYTLGAGVRYFAAGTAGATTTAGSDLDVYLLFDDNDDNVFEFDELVASAADGDSDEIAELVNPEPATTCSSSTAGAPPVVAGRPTTCTSGSSTRRPPIGHARRDRRRRRSRRGHERRHVRHRRDGQRPVGRGPVPRRGDLPRRVRRDRDDRPRHRPLTLGPPGPVIDSIEAPAAPGPRHVRRV